MDMKEIKENWPWLPLVNGSLIVFHLFLMSFLNIMLILACSLQPDVLLGGFGHPFDADCDIGVLTT